MASTAKELCCTWHGINRLKKAMAFICGGLVVAANVVGLIANIANIPVAVRSIWNVLFGVIMIFLQLGWKSFIAKNFGFLRNWCIPHRCPPPPPPAFFFPAFL